jgi:hypothetical protein
VRDDHIALTQLITSLSGADTLMEALTGLLHVAAWKIERVRERLFACMGAATAGKAMAPWASACARNYVNIH